MKSIVSDSIPNGTKFVAIYADGSGAALYAIDGGGELICSESGRTGIKSPDTHLLDSGYLYWIELPSTFQFWYEKK